MSKEPIQVTNMLKKFNQLVKKLEQEEPNEEPDQEPTQFPKSYDEHMHKVGALTIKNDLTFPVINE